MGQQQQDQRASRKIPSALTAVNLVEFVSLLLFLISGWAARSLARSQS